MAGPPTRVEMPAVVTDENRVALLEGGPGLMITVIITYSVINF